MGRGHSIPHGAKTTRIRPLPQANLAASPGKNYAPTEGRVEPAAEGTAPAFPNRAAKTQHKAGVTAAPAISGGIGVAGEQAQRGGARLGRHGRAFYLFMLVFS